MSEFQQTAIDAVAKIYGPWDRLSDKSRYVTTAVLELISMICILVATNKIGFWTFTLGLLLVASIMVHTMIKDGKLLTTKTLLAQHTAKVEAEHAAKVQDKDNKNES